MEKPSAKRACPAIASGSKLEKDINIDVLEAVIRFGFDNTNEKASERCIFKNSDE